MQKGGSGWGAVSESAIGRGALAGGRSAEGEWIRSAPGLVKKSRQERYVNTCANPGRPARGAGAGSRQAAPSGANASPAWGDHARSLAKCLRVSPPPTTLTIATANQLG